MELTTWKIQSIRAVEVSDRRDQGVLDYMFVMARLRGFRVDIGLHVPAIRARIMSVEMTVMKMPSTTTSR